MVRPLILSGFFDKKCALKESNLLAGYRPFCCRMINVDSNHYLYQELTGIKPDYLP
jgi:hypothetical protein